MSCNRSEDNNEALCGLKPILRGTWTANYPQEFFYRGPGGSSTNPCCGAGNNPCCGGGNNPCCGGNSSGGSNDNGGSAGVVRCAPQPVLSSSTGGAGPLPAISTSLATPINIVSTTVNTCSAGKTDNLVQFTCIVNAPSAVGLTLNFQIVRSSCMGGAVNVGPTFTFGEELSIVGTESFSFQFVDNNVAPGTYTYAVQLGTGTLVASAGVTVTNGVLSVLAVPKQQNDC